MWFAQLEEDGFAILRGLLNEQEVDRALAVLNSRDASLEHFSRSSIRDVLDEMPELRAFSEHAAVRAVVEHVLGTDAFVVRATLFDKTPASNWKVPWHQDLTIAVKERRDVDSYGRGPQKLA